MSVITITKENYDNEVIKSDKPVLVDFWASWCGPCKMLSPIVDEISEEVDDVKICKVNVDDEPELARKYNVMSIPMLAVIKDGKVMNTSVGLKPKKEILEMIKQ